MREFTYFRSSPRKRGPSGFVGHIRRDWQLRGLTNAHRPKNWVPAFAGMSGVWE
jgi:hypothetical protein